MLARGYDPPPLPFRRESIMRVPQLFLTAALAAAPLTAQSVQDVGLTMDGGILTVIYGQSCGPFACTPWIAGPVAPGQPRAVVVYGAPGQVYVLAIDLFSSQPCLPIPGLGNALILSPVPITLAVGVTGPGNPTSVCLQGRAAYSLSFPVGAPSGLPFLLQGLAMSASQNVPAFTVALQSSIQ